MVKQATCDFPLLKKLKMGMIQGKEEGKGWEGEGDWKDQDCNRKPFCNKSVMKMIHRGIKKHLFFIPSLSIGEDCCS